jgi:hypothetical protein
VRRTALPILLAIALFPGSVRAQSGPRLLATEGAGIVPVSGEVRLEIEGVRGDIGVRIGKPGEVRFLSREPGGRKAAEIPLSVWVEGTTLRLLPPEGEAPRDRVLEASVPPGLYVTIRAEGSKITASSLQGGLEVRGSALTVQAAAVDGDVEIDVQGGAVTVQQVAGSATVRASDAEVTLAGIRGSLLLTATGQRPAVVREVGGGIDADLDGTALQVENVKGLFRVRARAGSVAATGVEEGADLDLTDTALRMEKSKGDITVTTDSPCEFLESEASFHVDAYGPSARISGNKGLVEVRARNAEVVLEKIAGAARVEGDGLRFRADDVGGELVAILGLSEAWIQNVGGAMTVQSDRGDLEIRQATQKIEIKSEDGSLKLLDLNGPVLVDADGELVEVSWVSVPNTEDSSIRNEGGDVIVRFPSGGGAMVDAHAPFGRIETDISTVRLLDGDTRAEGAVNRRQRPVVRIDAGGDIQILGGSQ